MWISKFLILKVFWNYLIRLEYTSYSTFTLVNLLLNPFKKCDFSYFLFRNFPILWISHIPQTTCLNVYGINTECTYIHLYDVYSAYESRWLRNHVWFSFNILHVRTIGKILSNSYLSWLGWGTWQMGNTFWFIKELSWFSVSTVLSVITQTTRVLQCLSGHSGAGWYQQCLYTYNRKPDRTFRRGAYSKTC